MTYSVEDIQQMLANHPASHPKFFEYLDAKATEGLTAKQYQVFVNNYIARTLFTIPEVAAATLDAAMGLRPIGVAYGAATLHEEGGEGNPKKNHAQMMIDALNYHGKVVYGDAFTPVDPHELIALLKAFHSNMWAESDHQKIGHRSVPAFVQDALGRRAPYQAVADAYIDLNLPPDKPDTRIGQAKQLVDRLINPESLSMRRLNGLAARFEELGIHAATAIYAHEQIEVMEAKEHGLLAGCAFAHETLADDMMLRIFTLLHSQVDKYPGGEAEFDAHVYPYFASHGDYKAIARGEAHGDGVEAIHAQRELEKLREVIGDDQRVGQSAYTGACRFADRQNSVWNSIMSSMIEVSRDISPQVTDQHKR